MPLWFPRRRRYSNESIPYLHPCRFYSSVVGETYVYRGLLTVYMSSNLCRPSATHAERLSAEAYPISVLTNRCADAVGRDRLQLRASRASSFS